MAEQGLADSTDLAVHLDWFDRLYAEADAGRGRGAVGPQGTEPAVRAVGRRARHPRRRPAGAGRRLRAGSDSEYAGALGFDTVAFDFAPGAIEEVRRRFPDSPVDYRVAVCWTRRRTGRARSTSSSRA
jgi:hypothetical protein